MGGPGAAVLLRELFNDIQQTDLENLLNSIGIQDVEHDMFRIFTTTPLGEPYDTEHGWPFLINIETPSVDDTELTVIETTWGFIPPQQIMISAMSNSQESHRILGLLALNIAEKYDGIIDFCGALFPPLPQEVFQNNWFWEASWDDAAPYSRHLTESLSGTVVEALYLTISDRTWASHIADTTFLRAWLAHPDFHMIK